MINEWFHVYMIIDATNLILGRLASYSAKKVLLGEPIDIVNCENAVITGNNKLILAKYLQKIKRGIPLKGPYFPRTPEGIVKRTIRGMLPHKQYKGREALKRVKCYINVPEQFKDKKIETIKDANIEVSSSLKYITIKELCSLLRGS